MKKPQIKEFFTASDSLEKILLIADIYLVELTLSPESTTMQANYTMPSYMTRSDSLFVTKSMHPIKFHWTGKAFEQTEK